MFGGLLSPPVKGEATATLTDSTKATPAGPVQPRGHSRPTKQRPTYHPRQLLPGGAAGGQEGAGRAHHTQTDNPALSAAMRKGPVPCPGGRGQARRRALRTVTPTAKPLEPYSPRGKEGHAQSLPPPADPRPLPQGWGHSGGSCPHRHSNPSPQGSGHSHTGV